MRLLGSILNNFLSQTVFKNTVRTRVYLQNKNEVLLVKGWLNDGNWGLPGGGLDNNEKIKDCAIREVREELGLNIPKSDLVHLKTLSPTKKYPFTKEVFKACLEDKPRLDLQRLEIRTAQWFKIDEMPEKVDDTIKQSIKLL